MYSTIIPTNTICPSDQSRAYFSNFNNHQSIYIQPNSYRSFYEPLSTLRKKGYEQIEAKKREALIGKVFANNYSIKEAAIELGINYSTAKHIVRVYKESGNVKTKS